MVGQRIGNYRVVRQIGQGGMGVVYEAIRDDIGSRAALKVLRPEFAQHPETAARFFNEARAANLIEHPGIVKIFDYGQLPTGSAYLAMEFLSGESLHQRIHRVRRLSEPDTIRLGRQVAAALAAAHSKKVIHRDLKPDNIFIVPDAEAPGGERVKILDFGIAKLAANIAAIKTHTNMVMGTPIYMSPEQCRGGKNVDERADVYALGVILFEMVAGRPPFVADEPGEYIGLHLMQAPPTLGSLVPSASPAFQRLVDSMLSKEPQIRPAMATVAQMLKELGNLSSDVVSVRALAARQSPDGETQPLLRAGDILKHSDGLRPLLAAPVVPPAASLAVPPTPSHGSDSHTASLPLSTNDLVWAKVKGADPPTLKAAADGVDPTQSVMQQQNAPEYAVLEEVTAPGGHRRGGSEKKPGAKPPEPIVKMHSGPEDATAVLGAAALAKLEAKLDEKPEPRGLPPDWQPVQVMQAQKAPLEQLDADSPSSDDPERRVRSLTRRLRRLRFRLKKRLFALLGINEPEALFGQGSSMTMLARRRTALLVAILVVAILVCVIVLLAWQPAEQ